MSNEIDLSTCKICRRIKVRKQAGTYDGKNKRWMDQNNKLWCGRKCPDCQVDLMRSRMKSKRSKEVKNA